jgi:hypothetical protein
MTPNIIIVFLNLLCMIVFFILVILNKDLLVSQLFKALSLIFCLNTVRLVSGKKINTSQNHEKNTNT